MYEYTFEREEGNVVVYFGGNEVQVCATMLEAVMWVKMVLA